MPNNFFWEAYIREVPLRMYLTAERAFNKDETGMRLYWKTGYHINQLHEARARVLDDPRGRVIGIATRDITTRHETVIGWIRDDEINQKLEWVPTAYHILQDAKRIEDVDTPARVASKYRITLEMFKLWNPWLPRYREYIGKDFEGQSVIVGAGLPKYSENIFKLDDLINNRFKNVNNPEFWSVLIQGRPNTRYKVETNIPRHPATNKPEAYAGQPALLILDSNGVDSTQSLSVTADDNGVIELALADSELSSTNIGYQQVLNNQYWVRITVNTDPVPIPPLGVVTIDGKQYKLAEGANLFDDLVLKPGDNEVEIEGAEKIKVSFSYQTEVMG